MIKVRQLKKYYRTHSRKPGLVAAAKSFFDRKYTTFKALDGVSFDVEKGELLGVIGANGAGKTTMLKCLIGLLYPTDPKDTVLDVMGFRPAKREKRYLQQVSIVLGQKNQLWWDLPPSDSFELHRHLYEIPRKEFRERLDELVELLDVKDKIGTQVRRLSLGERMKMEIIAALLHGPKLVMLDEPTIGLDLSAQNAMRKFIRSYNKSHKTTFIITSHYMRDIEELCERVLFINEGQLLFDGELTKLRKLVPMDDTLNAQLNLEAGEEQKITSTLSTKFGARATVRDGMLTCVLPHAQVGKALEYLAQAFSLENVRLEAATMEQVIAEIYKDPAKLKEFQNLQ